MKQSPLVSEFVLGALYKELVRIVRFVQALIASLHSCRARVAVKAPCRIGISLVTRYRLARALACATSAAGWRLGFREAC